jgi:hypothetical protein
MEPCKLRVVGSIPTLSTTQGVGQSGRSPGLEPGSRRFKSCHPDEGYYSYMPLRYYIYSAAKVTVFFVDINGEFIELDVMPEVQVIPQWKVETK